MITNIRSPFLYLPISEFSFSKLGNIFMDISVMNLYKTIIGLPCSIKDELANILMAFFYTFKMPSMLHISSKSESHKVSVYERMKNTRFYQLWSNIKSFNVTPHLNQGILSK